MDILLVEDNSSDAYLLREIFARKSQTLDLHWVTDGYDALDYLFQRKQYKNAVRPDMILLDLRLPRISGYEVLKEIKSGSHFASIPVIILTTSLNPLDHRQCKALGADICISKPHGLKEYEEMVQRLINWAHVGLPSGAQGTIN